MKIRQTKTKLTPKQVDYEQLDMLGATPEELAKIMTPAEIQVMENYFTDKENLTKFSLMGNKKE